MQSAKTSSPFNLWKKVGDCSGSRLTRIARNLSSTQHIDDMGRNDASFPFPVASYCPLFLISIQTTYHCYIAGFKYGNCEKDIVFISQQKRNGKERLGVQHLAKIAKYVRSLLPNTRFASLSSSSLPSCKMSFFLECFKLCKTI